MRASLRRGLMLVLVGGSLALVGCTTGPTGASRTSMLGVVTSQSGQFDPVGPTTVGVTAREIGVGKPATGKQVKLLWGLITINHY